MAPPLDMALLGPVSAGSAAEMSGAPEPMDDAEIVAGDIFAAMEAKDSAALARGFRDMLDVLMAEREMAEVED